MIKKNQNSKKAKGKWSFIACFFIFSFLLTDRVWAAGCEIKPKADMNIDINEQAACMEERYGFGQDTMRSVNKKSDIPQVRIFFSESNPDEGEEVTANAAAMWFRNPPEDLHYTWYLVRANDEGSPIASRMTGEGGPIHLAMKKVAGGSFDPQLFHVDYDKAIQEEGINDLDSDGYTSFIGGKVDPSIVSFNNDKRWPSIEYRLWGDGEDDRYFADVERELVKLGVEPCFRRLLIDNVQNHRSGVDQAINCGHYYEHPSFAVTGDGKFFAKEEQYWGLDPNNGDTDGDGVLDEADVAGLNQTEFSWNYKSGDRVGVVVEGVSSQVVKYADGQSGKYKIMWAMPGICGSEASDSGFISGDMCDTGQDVGFPYMQAIPVNESVDEPAQIEINVTPESPQFFTSNHLLSSWVEAEGVVVNQEAYDSREVYYEWNVYKCQSSELATCIKNENLVTDQMEFLTKKEGLGVSRIKFKPNSALLQDSRETFFKVVAFTRRCKGDSKKGLAEKNFFYTKNPMILRVYKANFTETGQWEKTDELICEGGLSAVMCPVFYNQVVAVEAVLEDGYMTEEESSRKNFTWYSGGEPLQIPVDSYGSGRDCPEFFVGEYGCYGDGERSLIFFPILNKGKSDINLKAVASLSDPDRQMEESAVHLSRTINFYSYIPFLKIINEQAAGSQAIETEIPGSLSVDAGQLVVLSVKSKESFSPDYMHVNWIYDPVEKKILSDDGGFELRWEVDGIPVSEDFEDVLELYSIGSSFMDDPGSIVLQIPRDFISNSSVNVKVQLRKRFSDSYIDSMNIAWGTGSASQGELVSDSGVNLLVGLSGEEEGFASIEGFFASTFKNYPRYLEMITKLSVAAMLMIFCGYFYFDRAKRKI